MPGMCQKWDGGFPAWKVRVMLSFALDPGFPADCRERLIPEKSFRLYEKLFVVIAINMCYNEL